MARRWSRSWNAKPTQRVVRYQKFQLLGRQHRNFGDLLCGRVEVNRVHQRQLPPGHHQDVHCGVNIRAGAPTEHLIDMSMRPVCAKSAAEHAVGLALVHHHRADQGQPATHFDFCVLLRDASARSKSVIRFPVIAIALVELGIDQIEVHLGSHAQTKTLESLGKDCRAADQDRPRQVFVDHHLTARSTLSSSPSANTMRDLPPPACAFFAIAKIGFMNVPE